MNKKKIIKIMATSYRYISSRHNDKVNLAYVDATGIKTCFLFNMNNAKSSRFYLKYIAAYKRINTGLMLKYSDLL